ncbi:NUDIX hydrolase [Abyssisolibacter fermentans]|uniref:NUDIX hydrolase n=1 Tax=Abyssisolibacter fermentans TaxID=1766203 RepID=UPI00082C7A8A|nr:NUDIX hydrolase [Abyssisolibacter fermentans]
MGDYIGDLRKLVGTRPIIMCGANVILINKEGAILLHHRTDRDWWGLPGGAMELGESLEETAKREVKEEVNLECHKLMLLNVFSGKELYYKYPDGNEVYNVTATYVCKDYRGDIKVDMVEGRDAKFFAIDEIPENLSDPIRVCLDEFIDRYSEFY